MLLTSAYPLPDWHESRHEVFYYLNIISHLEKELTGTTTSGQQPPDASLTLSDERKAGARNLLHGLGLRDEQLLVALCPGSINSRAKRWPAERFADLADRLIKELDAQVILIGSSAEQDVSAEVERQMKLVPVTLTGKTSLSELVAVLSQADLLITNDTGPAHIAAAVGTPTLVIFGPTNPVTTRPFSDVAEMLRQPPDCAPCMLRDCPIDHRCMTAIASDEVYRRAAAMLLQKPERVASNGLRAVGS
jgi:heptosyltransferase-2